MYSPVTSRESNPRLKSRLHIAGTFDVQVARISALRRRRPIGFADLTFRSGRFRRVSTNVRYLCTRDVKQSCGSLA